MSFVVTTVFPDGRVETRPATQEEIAQREADILEVEAYETSKAQAFQEKQNNLASAIAKFEALGLTSDEIAAVLALS